MATTKTGAVFSCNQVRNAPKIRRLTPPSPSAPAMPPMAFSNSSIHRTAGAIDSASAMAFRKFFSDSPTYLSYNRPASSFSNGNRHSLAIALAASDLPHPCTPTIQMPLGGWRFKARASGVKPTRARCSHSLSRRKPPTR